MPSKPERDRSVVQTLQGEPIQRLKLPPFPCVPRKTSLRDAIARMKAHRSGTVLIGDADRLDGIFTERDVLMKLLGQTIDYDAPVERYMTTNPRTLGPHNTLAEAVRLMTEGKYRHLPIVDAAGKPLGLLGARDLVDFIAEHFPEEVMNLPPQMHQVSYAPEGG